MLSEKEEKKENVKIVCRVVKSNALIEQSDRDSLIGQSHQDTLLQ